MYSFHFLRLNVVVCQPLVEHRNRWQLTFFQIVIACGEKVCIAKIIGFVDIYSEALNIIISVIARPVVCSGGLTP